MIARVQATHAAHGPVLQQYHDVWYQAPHTWQYTSFMGVGLMKCPNDLWAYQDLMTRHRPRTIIETGTFLGGSALWLAALSDLLGIDTKVYTIDIANHRACTHPKITFLLHDSRSRTLVRDLAAEIRHPLLVILDADHSRDHVFEELRLYAPLCEVGDWLVVEDTNISWPGPKGDRGAGGAVADYLTAHPHDWRQDILCERWLLTMNPGGWLQRIRA